MGEEDDDVEKSLKEKIWDRLKALKRETLRVALLGKYLLIKSSMWKDVGGLMEKCGYPGERLTRVHIMDMNTHITFKMSKEGKLVNTDFIKKYQGKEPDYEVSICHFKDLFYIRVGKKPGVRNDQRVLFPYNPGYAWAHDDIRVHGAPNAPNEVRGACDLFMTFIERIPVEDLARITNMTGPELVELGHEDIAKKLGFIQDAKEGE